MGGKRYDGEPKLNKKKVFSVMLGLIVVAMFFVTLSKILSVCSMMSIWPYVIGSKLPG